MGFTKPLLSRGTLGVSYTSVSPLPAPRGAAGGLLSVALSVGFAPEALWLWSTRRPAVSRHPARWCPDFPHPRACLHLGRGHAPSQALYSSITLEIIPNAGEFRLARGHWGLWYSVPARVLCC